MFYDVVVKKNGTEHSVSFVDSYELQPLLTGSENDGYEIVSVSRVIPISGWKRVFQSLYCYRPRGGSFMETKRKVLMSNTIEKYLDKYDSRWCMINYVPKNKFNKLLVQIWDTLNPDKVG